MDEQDHVGFDRMGTWEKCGNEQEEATIALDLEKRAPNRLFLVDYANIVPELEFATGINDRWRIQLELFVKFQDLVFHFFSRLKKKQHNPRDKLSIALNPRAHRTSDMRCTTDSTDHNT